MFTGDVPEKVSNTSEVCENALKEMEVDPEIKKVLEINSIIERIFLVTFDPGKKNFVCCVLFFFFFFLWDSIPGPLAGETCALIIVPHLQLTEIIMH